MTVQICQHEVIYENYATPADPNKMQYRVQHPPTQRNFIPSYTVYTVEEVNQLLKNLRAEIMAEIQKSSK